MMHILIVEDNPVARTLFQEQVRKLGYAVTVCPDAETALRCYQQRVYPIIMLDLGLPGMDGFEFCRQIRALSPQQQSLILVVTAYDDAEDIQKALDAGADDYLIKPVSFQQLQVRLTIIERRFHAIMSRHKAEARIKSEQARAQQYLDLAAVMFVAVDLEHRITMVNKRGCDILGYAEHELLGLQWFDQFVPPEHVQHIQEMFSRLLSGEVETAAYYENPIRTRSGELKLIAWHNSVIKNEQRENIGMLSAGEDITTRKAAEEALRRSEQQYRLLVKNVADGIGIVQEQRLIFVNDALASMLGCSVEQIIGKSLQELFHQVREPLFSETDEPASFAEGALSKLHCIVAADQREIWLEGQYSPITWEGRSALLLNLRDITQRRLWELAIEEERDDLRRENRQLRSTIKERYRFGELIGKSQAMQDVYKLILKAAASEKDMLICGESGTGKELVAHTIHQLSRRQKHAYVPVNCGAVPESLFEREFFGHRKGSFTGATHDKRGLFEAADGGTLFLDEVGELPPSMQVKLLRVIENGEYTPLGDTQPRKVDVRILAATNKNLHTLVSEARMREDFFYRIHVIVINVPPLRQRREDIPLLIDHFVEQYRQTEKPAFIPGKILEVLYNYDWPGNIRQLRNVLHRYLAVGDLQLINPHETASSTRQAANTPRPAQPLLPLREAVQECEKQLILRTLEQHRWNRGETAQALQIDPKTLYRKMKTYQII